MEDMGIHFSSLTVHEDEDEFYSSEEDEESSSSEEEEEDEVEDVRSPAHPYDLDSLPKSVILDVDAYFDDRTNTTTAFAPLWKKHSIQVTLWIAHPPCVSCLTVHSSGVGAKDFANTPMILAAQDDLLLLRATLGPHDRLGPTRYVNNYYVYKAGTKPSLTRLADASSYPFSDCSAGILRRGDGSFIIAAIRYAGTHGQYDLHQFDSKTSSWSTRLMHVDKPERFSHIHASKVLVIGGKHGLVAWVDLWYGILFCEVLTNRTVLRYCPLPPPLNKVCIGRPEYVRDIAIVQGSIKFFEMRVKDKQRQVAYNTTVTSRVLVAATWKMMEPWQEWHKDCAVLDLFKIRVDESSSELLSNLLRNRQGTQLSLERLEEGLPTLSLHDDDVVYIMAKTKQMNRRAVVLAVNLRNKVLQGVAKFDAERTYGFSYTYLQSGISNYLTVGSSVSYKRIDEFEASRLRKYGRTTADSSKLPVTQAGDTYKGKNAADSSRLPITQAGDMYKGKDPADSSRRPITQAGDIYEGENAADSTLEISRARKQKHENRRFRAKNPIESKQRKFVDMRY